MTNTIPKRGDASFAREARTPSEARKEKHGQS